MRSGAETDGNTVYRHGTTGSALETCDYKQPMRDGRRHAGPDLENAGGEGRMNLPPLLHVLKVDGFSLVPGGCVCVLLSATHGRMNLPSVGKRKRG